MSSSDILYHSDVSRQDEGLEILAKIIARAIIQSQQSKPEETLGDINSSTKDEPS